MSSQAATWHGTHIVLRRPCNEFLVDAPTLIQLPHSETLNADLCGGMIVRCRYLGWSKLVDRFPAPFAWRPCRAAQRAALACIAKRAFNIS
jgi:hypothetical protein